MDEKAAPGSTLKLRVGVLSDTHARSLVEIRPELLDALSEVDLIVHAGDIVTRNVIDGLKGLKEVRAVRGNMDPPELRKLLPEKEVFTFNGKRIGVTHGAGEIPGIERRVRSMFGELDVIVYGHSHRALNEVIDGVLLFNPGTARSSYGILTVGEEVLGEIFTL